MLPSLNYYASRFGMSGLLRHLRARLTGVPLLLSVQPEGVAFPFQLRCLTSDIPTFDKIFVSNEYAFDVDRQPSVIVDAGANIGLASIYLANRYPSARILSVEPEAGNFALLQRNTQPYPQITPVLAALWRENADIDLVDPGLGSWGFMTEGEATRAEGKNPPTRQPGGRSRVRGTTVDRLIADHGIDRISILKMDIEGAEREVFEDSSAWLARVDGMIVELHDRMKPGCSQSFDDGTPGFDHRWNQGENVYLSRRGCLVRPASSTS